MLKAKWFSLTARPTTRGIALFLFYLFLAIATAHVAIPPKELVLPDEEHPFSLYHGPHVSLEQVVLRAIDCSQKSIYIECYAIDHAPLLDSLKRAAQRGVHIEIFFDPKASLGLMTYFSAPTPNLILKAYTGKALMHRKILLIDDETVFFGSSNFTKSSLLLHENILIGMHQPSLARHLHTPLPPMKKGKPDLQQGGYSIQNQFFKARFFRLPEERFAAQALLYQKLQQAEKSIHIAMFTFTHPKIARVLSQCASQGVQVKMLLDNQQKHLSTKLLPQLRQAGVEIISHRRGELFHHKWALIDGKEWIVGSVNWTKNGFHRNTELIAFIEILDPYLGSELETVWKQCCNF